MDVCVCVCVCVCAHARALKCRAVTLCCHTLHYMHAHLSSGRQGLVLAALCRSRPVGALLPRCQTQTQSSMPQGSFLCSASLSAPFWQGCAGRSDARTALLGTCDLGVVRDDQLPEGLAKVLSLAPSCWQRPSLQDASTGQAWLSLASLALAGVRHQLRHIAEHV